MSLGNYSTLALTVERKLDPRVLEAALRPSPPPGSLLADFALRVLRNLDTLDTSFGEEEESQRLFAASIRDLAEDLRRNI